MFCVRESTKPILCSEWGHFDRARPILKILLAFWTFGTVEKRLRSFNSENLGSVGQRVLKLLAVKVGVLKKKSAASAIQSEMCACAIGPGSSWSGVESFSNVEGW